MKGRPRTKRIGRSLSRRRGTVDSFGFDGSCVMEKPVARALSIAEQQDEEQSQSRRRWAEPVLNVIYHMLPYSEKYPAPRMRAGALARSSPQAREPLATRCGTEDLLERKCSATRSMISASGVCGRKPVRESSLSTQGTRRIMSSKPGSYAWS